LLAAFFKITTGILSIEKKLGQKCLDKKLVCSIFGCRSNGCLKSKQRAEGGEMQIAVLSMQQTHHKQ
jgi:hypothetical protein